ncbi:MAG: hypothetical protein K8953_11115, partial [Proteobacteria bacterium]|nr:hypothetical protein [Pseudomonadota bacterium]
QICWLIASLSILTLSACVGAVNVPSEVAEKVITTTDPDPVIKKTAVVIIDDKEPEPIVVDPQVAFISRCSMDGNANDASCAPIVADNPCIRDPFGAACDITFANFYKTAQANRISFCRENPKHDLCISAIANVCTDNPLDADLCFNDNTYYKTQESMCEADPTAPRCETTVSRVCARNAFDTNLCFGNSDYNNSRETTCTREPNSVRCETITMRICTNDIFNPYCANAEAYHPAQYAVCEGEPNSERCEATITRVCDADSLDVICTGKATYFSRQQVECERRESNSERCDATYARVCEIPSGYYTMRTNLCKILKSLCETDNTKPRCAATIAWICDDDPLHALCNGLTEYYPAQEARCGYGRGGGSKCDATFSRVCGADIFNTICKNRTEYYVAQKTACDADNTDPRCASLIAEWCPSNPLNVICVGLTEYFTAQLTECKRGYKRYYRPLSRTEGQCAPTTERVCGGADALNSYCKYLSQYEPAQKAACDSDNPDYRCPPIMARLCIDTPFDTACQKNNLTNYDWNYIYTIRGLPTEYICSQSQHPNAKPTCYFNLSSAINITP